MTESFGVETIQLDLPALVGALSRRLHDAGLPVTPARAADVARALTLVRPGSRGTLYWAIRSVVVTEGTQVKVFDAVFAEVFGGGSDDEPEVELEDVTTVPDWQNDEAPGSTSGDDDESEQEIPLTIASADEVLRTKRFDALAPDELAELYRLMTALELATPLRRTRRYEKRRRGERIDLRRTLRGSLRTGGDPVRLRRRRRRVVPRRLVLLCDISGSMEPYARAYLQFLACAAGCGPNAEAFAFATRLTRLTRALRSRNPERAIQRAAAAAPDWSSGTRIGEALRAFNDHHGRRGMARGAVVVILSDGWERGDPALVGRELERLSRLAYRIVWVNPRMAADAFSVRAGGMVAALPHIDALVSGHSFAALREVAEAIAGEGEAPPPVVEPAPEEVEPDPWPSATPVAGSSVAMPSGHGPSRGNTTPGWVTDE
ncbi:MAG TPA: VWA domain-containing protein [Solirubrobacteraceae bacterium]|nr:VWA domain-containing protein [Solirubrobacteraceae bacterium]